VPYTAGQAESANLSVCTCIVIQSLTVACEIMRDSGFRIFCGLLGGMVAASIAFAAAAQVVAGRWELIDYDQDRPTNKSQIALWLSSDVWIDNPAPTSRYDVRGMPLLSIQCRDGQPVFYINPNFEVPAGAVAVTYRFDDGVAVDGTWKSDGITIAPSDGVAFVRSMLGKQKLSLTITFAGAKPTGTVFEIARLDTALQALRPHCSW
jgi:hypothetical protein